MNWVSDELKGDSPLRVNGIEITGEQQVSEEWKSATEKPQPGVYYCLVDVPDNKRRYVHKILMYGQYDYYAEYGTPTLLAHESYDEDESKVSGNGWYDHVNGHGGEYDYYLETFGSSSSYGEVCYYKPLETEPH